MSREPIWDAEYREMASTIYTPDAAGRPSPAVREIALGGMALFIPPHGLGVIPADSFYLP